MGRTIPVTIDGVDYPSRSAAAQALGVSRSNICAAIARKTTHRLGTGRGGPEPLPVCIRGVVYPGGAAEAAAKLGVTRSAVYRALGFGDADRVGRSRRRPVGGHTTGRPFRIGRLEWPSMLAAERDLGLPRQYISRVRRTGSKAGQRRIIAAAMALQAARDAAALKARREAA